MKKLLILGDTCVDEVYTVLPNFKLNPENSDVPIHKIINRSSVRIGMSGIIFEILLESLEDVQPFISIQHIVSESSDISTKQRFYTKNGEYYMRLDQDTKVAPIAVKDIDAALTENCRGCVISDYNKGSITPGILAWVDEQVNRGRLDFCIVDTKKTNLSFLKYSLVKINTPEYERLVGIPRYLIRTDGPNPIHYYEGGVLMSVHEVPKLDPLTKIDICGAGDAFTAGLAYKFITTPPGPSLLASAIQQGCHISSKYITR